VGPGKKRQKIIRREPDLNRRVETTADFLNQLILVCRLGPLGHLVSWVVLVQLRLSAALLIFLLNRISTTACLLCCTANHHLDAPSPPRAPPPPLTARVLSLHLQIARLHIPGTRHPPYLHLPPPFGRPCKLFVAKKLLTYVVAYKSGLVDYNPRSKLLPVVFERRPPRLDTLCGRSKTKFKQPILPYSCAHYHD
jgi:hypothetical protein